VRFLRVKEQNETLNVGDCLEWHQVNNDSVMKDDDGLFLPIVNVANSCAGEVELVVEVVYR
jgi:hypothetical protein